MINMLGISLLECKQCPWCSMPVRTEIEYDKRLRYTEFDGQKHYIYIHHPHDKDGNAIIGANLRLSCKSHPNHELNVVYDAGHIDELKEIVEKYGVENKVVSDWGGGLI